MGRLAELLAVRSWSFLAQESKGSRRLRRSADLLWVCGAEMTTTMTVAAIRMRYTSVLIMLLCAAGTCAAHRMPAFALTRSASKHMQASAPTVGKRHLKNPTSTNQQAPTQTQEHTQCQQGRRKMGFANFFCMGGRESDAQISAGVDLQGERQLNFRDLSDAGGLFDAGRLFRTANMQVRRR